MRRHRVLCGPYSAVFIDAGELFGSPAQAVLTEFESQLRLLAVLPALTEPPGALVSPPVKWQIEWGGGRYVLHSTELGSVKCLTSQFVLYSDIFKNVCYRQKHFWDTKLNKI